MTIFGARPPRLYGHKTARVKWCDSEQLLPRSEAKEGRTCAGQGSRMPVR
uniref:Uncharacterized protein n=1 Tax=Pyricularia oryzae (strain P131) TaxID=1143193 RepID=L7IVY4_PYRO1